MANKTVEPVVEVTDISEFTSNQDIMKKAALEQVALKAKLAKISGVVKAPNQFGKVCYSGTRNGKVLPGHKWGHFESYFSMAPYYIACALSENEEFDRAGVIKGFKVALELLEKE